MKLHLICCVVAMAWTVPAYADEQEEARSTLIRTVSSAKNGSFDSATLKSCRDAAAVIIKTAPPTWVFSTYDLTGYPKVYKAKDRDNLKRDDVGVICDEYEKRHEKMKGVGAATDTVERANKAIGMLDGTVRGIYTETHLAQYETLLKECKGAAAVLKEAGVTRLSQVPGVADFDKGVCDVLAKVMVTYRVDVAEAVARAKAERAALEKSYKAVGIGGEKLEFMIDMDGKALYGVGGKELTTPKAKTASVMFSVSTADDGTVTVTRYQFNGNAHTKTTPKDYPLGRPGPSAFK